MKQILKHQLDDQIKLTDSDFSTNSEFGLKLLKHFLHTLLECAIK